MRFWDSSALLPLVLDQDATPAVRDLLRSDAGVALWLLSDVEMRSGIARLLREGAMTFATATAASTDLEALWRGAHVVAAVEAVKVRAIRALGVHALRAADALQLGAALAFAEDDPRGVDLVTLDARLAGAARREGFRVLPD